MTEKRNKQIIIRVTEQEHQDLLAKKDCPRLAEFIRNKALDSPIHKKRVAKKVDPVFLSAINKIGSNVNQCAKALNIIAKQSKLNEREFLEVANVLIEMEQHLKELVEKC